MADNSAFAGKWFKTGLAALGAGVLGVAAMAVPLTSAVAHEEVAAEGGDAALTAEQMTEGRDLFGSWSCGACHVLTEAGGGGHIGPALDGNNSMDMDFAINRITNGQGQMPGFGGQLGDDEIALLAAYIMQVKK